MIHPTKKDAWLLWGMTAVILFLLGKGAHLIAAECRLGPGLLLIGIGVFTAGVFYSFATYEITARELVTRSQLYGIRFGSLPLESIDRVYPTRNPLSAPAWSLDRLQIDYRTPEGKERFGLVSPRDRDAFLRELAAAAPHLELRGNTLQRREATSAGEAPGPGDR
ncbi:MAG: PH domain-containing protein [Deltaproteobacteria bacterium]|nr:PH domain-containing protein [Deltaproteobacteria bacterium]